MNDDLVLLTEFSIDNNLIDELMSEGKELSEKDIDNDILKILRDNKVEYKIKIEEKWIGDHLCIYHEYNLVAKIFVNKIDFEKCLNLFSSDQIVIENIDELINAEEIIDDEYEEENNIENNNNTNVNNDAINENQNDEVIKDSVNHIFTIVFGILIITFFGLLIVFLMN